MNISFFQSNSEAEIIDEIQKSQDYDGFIINAGALTHTSIAIHDALKILKIPKIEVQEVFSSNGSAELANLYIKKIKLVSHTCIIGAKSFTKLDHIKNRVISSNPNELVIRDYKKIYSCKKNKKYSIYKLRKNKILEIK